MAKQSNTRLYDKLYAVRCLFLAIALVCVAGYSSAAAEGESEFKGKISERYEDSVEWWPQTVPPTPKERRMCNILGCCE